MSTGVAAYRDLLQLGVGPSRIRTMALHQGWAAIRRGVYGEAIDASLQLRLRAADVGLGRGWVTSHGTAAALHHLVLLRPPALDRLVLTVDRGTPGHSDPSGVHVHRARTPAWHVTEVEGIRVMSVARTLIDLARVLPLREGLIAVDAALYREQTTLDELHSVLGDCRRWPGVRRAVRVVAMADPRCESPLESVSRVFFIEQDLPLPASQVRLTRRGALLGRVDFWWEPQRVAGEADGMSKYTEPSVLRAEKLRQERIEQAGVAVVRWTWPDVTRRERAAYTAGRLRRALGLAA